MSTLTSSPLPNLANDLSLSGAKSRWSCALCVVIHIRVVGGWVFDVVFLSPETGLGSLFSSHLFTP